MTGARGADPSPSVVDRDEGSSFHRPLTAHEAVLAELRSWILTRKLLPGEPIRQEAIAAELGVSRVPIREALKILEGEGHVVYRPYRGYSLVELDVGDLEEIYRIRQLLEDEAVRRSLPNLGSEEIERMHDLIDDMEQAGRAEAIVELARANRRFHFTLFESAGMPRLQHDIQVLWDESEPYRTVYYLDRAHRAVVNDEHRSIMAHVESGDLEALLAALHLHRQHAIGELAEVLGRGRGSGGHVDR